MDFTKTSLNLIILPCEQHITGETQNPADVPTSHERGEHAGVPTHERLLTHAFDVQQTPSVAQTPSPFGPKNILNFLLFVSYKV